MHPGQFYTRLKTNPRISRWLTPLARLAWSAGRDVRRWLPLARVPGLKQWSRRPAGFWPRVEDYLAASSQDGSIKVIYPAGGTMRQPVESLRAPAEIFVNAPPMAWPAGRAFELRNTRLVGGYGGSVISDDNRIIAELSPDIWGVRKHELFSRLRLPEALPLAGVTAMLATPEAPDNYSHWLFDLLPRWLMLEQSGWTADLIDHVVVNAGSAGFCLETLSALGVPAGKVRRLGAAEAYRTERMVTASMDEAGWWNNLPPPVCAELSARLLTVKSTRTGSFPRRLYLSRRGAKFRRLVNEDQVVALFREQGFEEFQPDRYSFAEQVAAFRAAEMVAGSHGAALCNLLFCRPGTAVMEIHAPSHVNFSYWTLASHGRLRYTAVMGEPLDARAEQAISTPVQGQNRGTKFLDFKIGLEALREEITAFMRKQG